jgi:hypothetical protein
MEWDKRKLMAVLRNFTKPPQTCFFAKTAHLTENTKLDNSSFHTYQGVNYSLSLTIPLRRYRCKDSVPALEQLSQNERHDLVLKLGTQICITSFYILNKFTSFRPCLFTDFYHYSVYLTTIY